MSAVMFVHNTHFVLKLQTVIFLLSNSIGINVFHYISRRTTFCIMFTGWLRIEGDHCNAVLSNSLIVL